MRVNELGFVVQITTARTTTIFSNLPAGKYPLTVTRLLTVWLARSLALHVSAYSCMQLVYSVWFAQPHCSVQLQLLLDVPRARQLQYWYLQSLYHQHYQCYTYHYHYAANTNSTNKEIVYDYAFYLLDTK